MSRNNRNRNTLIPPGFSLRRLLLQGARAARGSPPLSQRSCDIEKGNSKCDKKSGDNLNGNNGNKNNLVETTSQLSSTPTQSFSSSNQQNTQRQSSKQQLQHQLDLNNSSVGSNNGCSGGNETIGKNDVKLYCPICYNTSSPESFFTLSNCKHMACCNCLEKYLKNEINESRTDIACPQCSEAMHPSNIEVLLKDYPEVISKYEDFMVRRFLLADPDSRWCPAPDCCYAVIATGCASCPRIRCQRPGCGVNFCYHCKAEWHPDQTCDAARASRQSPTRAPSGSISQDSQHRDDIKPCPRCQVLIGKMDDGSCNHMVCSLCGSEFCWLCMKEVSDLHYLSPSGCTFWGKKPWSRKKKLLWQLGTLVGAPVGIALVAGIAVPAMIIGIPVWVGKKIHARYKSATKHKRNCAVLGGVAASVLVSPVLAGLAVAIGVPILLFYVYGVVPVSLCRAGCGVSTTRDGFKFEFDEEEEDNHLRNQSDGASVDAVSRIGATSIGEVSLSVASGSHIGVSGAQNTTFGVAHSSSSNRESTTALAGSITGHRLEVQADVSSSETASAVTCVSEKSGNTLNDTASTKALAGSILSYKLQLDLSNVSEDTTSERVRFDNTVCYVIDGKKENSDVWYAVPLEQDSTADKCSVGSSRSFRSSERSFREDVSGDVSSTVPGTTVSCGAKRLAFGNRIPKLSSSVHRTLSLDSNNGSNNIPENVTLEQQAEEEDKETLNSNKSSCAVGNLNINPKLTTTSIPTSSSSSSNSVAIKKIPQANNDVGKSMGISSQTLNTDQILPPSNENNLANINNNNCTSSSFSGATNSNKEDLSSPLKSIIYKNVSTSAAIGNSNNFEKSSKTSILRNLFFSETNPSMAMTKISNTMDINEGQKANDSYSSSSEISRN